LENAKSQDGERWHVLAKKIPIDGGPFELTRDMEHFPSFSFHRNATLPCALLFAALCTAAQAQVAPVFTVQPLSQTAAPGSTVSLTAAASGVPTPTYQWWRNGITFPYWYGQTLTLEGITSNDDATYTVVATNSAGSTTSAAAVVTVGSTTSSGYGAPVFTTQPTNQTAAPGSTVYLTAAASGTPTYQWWRNGMTFGSWTGAVLSLYGLTSNDEGTYTVVATNSAGSATSAQAVVTIGSNSIASTVPVFTTQPASQTATAGSTVYLTAAASGTPAPTYQWWRNGTTDSSWTGPTLTVSGVKSSDQGTYSVVATNSAGSAMSNGAIITVTSSASGDSAPVFTTQPASQTAAPGSTVYLTAAASGTPTPTYQWWRNGVTYSGWSGPVLTLEGLSSNDQATYTVVATNSAGSATSAGAFVSVASGWSSDVAPAFTTQPISQSVAAGGTVYLTAAASGTPAPTYQWKRNGVAYPAWTGPTLTLSGFSSNDQGTYTVVATNSAGSVTSSPATVTVTSGVTSGPISLAWNDNSGNESGFKIERAVAGQAYSEIATVGTNVTTFTDANVTPSTSYWYRVRATSASGDSGYTNVITVTAR
jgi:large repetitive protein